MSQVSYADYPAAQLWRPLASSADRMALHDHVASGLSVSQLSTAVKQLFRLEGRFLPGSRDGDDRQLVLEPAERVEPSPPVRQLLRRDADPLLCVWLGETQQVGMCACMAVSSTSRIRCVYGV